MLGASLVEMQAPDSTSSSGDGRPAWLVVESPLAIGVLFDREHRARLAPFVARPCTVGEVASALGEELKRTYYFVQRYLAAGLLERVETRPRRGRAVIAYRAPANGYFVPIEHFPAVDLAEGLDHIYLPLVREFHRHLADAAEPHLLGRWGRRVHLDPNGALIPEGGPHPDHGSFDAYDLYARPDFPPAWIMWHEIYLTADEAKRLQLEILAFSRRIEAERADEAGRRKHMVHIGLTPV